MLLQLFKANATGVVEQAPCQAQTERGSRPKMKGRDERVMKGSENGPDEQTSSPVSMIIEQCLFQLQ